MTNLSQEFSNKFDVLYSNIMSNQAPGLDEYEKSIFLTKSQDEILKSYFNPSQNKAQEGFDGSKMREIDFSSLIVSTRASEVQPVDVDSLVSNSKFYKMPDNILVYINEFATVTRDNSEVKLTVLPISYTELNTLMSKPYKRPLKYQAWKIIHTGQMMDYQHISELLSGLEGVTASTKTIYNNIFNKQLTVVNDGLKVVEADNSLFLCKDGSLKAISSTTSQELVNVSSIKQEIVNPSLAKMVEIAPGHNDIITKYSVRYLSRPNPIILSDLEDEGVSINGQTKETPCELDPILHEEIIQRAVELAKAAYAGDLTSTISVGNASATEKGVLQRGS